MTFLNGLLAAGALAFTVPLVIHLLFRNRFETLDWGAMRFLQSILERNRRRMKLRNWLLLLIRCAIPILLAFCLARPVLTGWRPPRGDRPVALAVVLDNSYTMAAREADDTNRLEVALRAVDRIVGSLARGSEITLLTSDGTVRAAAPDAIAVQLAEIRPGGASFDLESLVGKAIGVASQSPLPDRQILILSDHAATGYTQTLLDGLPGLRQRIDSVMPTPDVAWVDLIGAGPTPFRNLRVHRVETDSNLAVPGQSVPWLVEARVDGPAPEMVDVVARVNGEVRSRRSEPMRDGVARAVIPIRIDTVGRHVVEFSVSASRDVGAGGWTDDFPPDDRMAFPVRVFDPIDVWLVDGNPSNKPLGSDTDYLALALSPFAIGLRAEDASASADRFRPRKVPFGRLTETQRASDWPAVVVLADVARPSAADAKWLVDFVRNQGGTLAVFGGPSVDSEWYERQLVDESGNALLPMRFGEERLLEDGVTIDESRLTYPPLAIFGDREKGTLSGTAFRGLLEMVPRSERGANVILRLEDGQPLIAVGGGEDGGWGRVIQFASTCNDRWTTLPLRPSFVPLMQRLLLHVSIAPDSGVVPTAGQPIVFGVAAGDTVWNVTTPDGRSRRWEIDADAATDRPTPSSVAEGDEPDAAAKGLAVVWTDTPDAGGYRFESESGEVVWAAVQVAEADRKPAVVDPETRRDAAGRLGAAYHESVDAYLATDTEQRFGRGIWQWLLIALLAAMILEPFVQQYHGRVRRSGADQAIR